MLSLLGCRRGVGLAPRTLGLVVRDVLGGAGCSSGLSTASSSRSGLRERRPDRSGEAPLAAVVADGWTPHRGRVMNQTSFGAFVDFGCEMQGLIPLRSSQQLTDPERVKKLRVGERVEVFVVSKSGKKVNLSLVPRERPHLRWDDIIADGCTPYQGRITSRTDYGTFVDLMAEQPGLLLREKGLDELRVGDDVTVYVRDKRRDTRKISLSLHRAPIVRKSWDDLVADGVTPYEGILTNVDPAVGAFVDLGCERCALLPLLREGESGPSIDKADPASLEIGSKVTVYVVRKVRNSRRLLVTLRKRMVPLTPIADLVADGQTPREGVVRAKADYGAWVDIGCEANGLVPVDQWLDPAAFESLAVGDRLVTYVLTLSRDSGKVGLGLRRSERPRERWAAIVSDGKTPYEGTVTSRSWYGVFVDIGCERNARLTSALTGLGDERLCKLKVGDRITVYVIEKRTDTGKIMASIDPSEATLKKVEELAADGQTGYYGCVTCKNDLGAWVDIGSDRVGIVRRSYLHGNELEALDALSVGDPVLVYIVRRNPTNGRLLFSLQPSAEPRRSLADVLASSGTTIYDGVVYFFKHESVHVDFGCETGGVLPRSEVSPGCAVGDVLRVKAVGFDREKGRFLLAVTSEHSESSEEVPPPPPAPPPTPPPHGSEAADAGGLSTASPRPRGSNQKGQLQNEVMKHVRRELTQGDLVYTSERLPDGQFLTHLEVPALPSLAGRRFAGEPRQRKVEAEHSAAASALAEMSMAAARGGQVTAAEPVMRRER